MSPYCTFYFSRGSIPISLKTVQNLIKNGLFYSKSQTLSPKSEQLCPKSQPYWSKLEPLCPKFEWKWVIYPFILSQIWDIMNDLIDCFWANWSIIDGTRVILYQIWDIMSQICSISSQIWDIMNDVLTHFEWCDHSF
jgi:hypothetical protein